MTIGSAVITLITALVVVSLIFGFYLMITLRGINREAYPHTHARILRISMGAYIIVVVTIIWVIVDMTFPRK